MKTVFRVFLVILLTCSLICLGLGELPRASAADNRSKCLDGVSSNPNPCMTDNNTMVYRYSGDKTRLEATYVIGGTNGEDVSKIQMQNPGTALVQYLVEDFGAPGGRPELEFALIMPSSMGGASSPQTIDTRTLPLSAIKQVTTSFCDGNCFQYSFPTMNVYVDGKGSTANVYFFDKSGNAITVPTPAGSTFLLDYKFSAAPDVSIVTPNNPILTVTASNQWTAPNVKSAIGVCTTSTAYISNGNFGSSTNLSTERFSDGNLATSGTTPWTYNAMGYNQNDGWLYAMSEKSSTNATAYPSGHILQINPNDGSVNDVGKVRNIPQAELDADITSGFVDSSGKLWVTNPSTKGSGTFYTIDPTTLIATSFPVTATQGSLSRPLANDYAYMNVGGVEYAFGLVSQLQMSQVPSYQSSFQDSSGAGYSASKVYMERVVLSGSAKGNITRFDVTNLADPSGKTLNAYVSAQSNAKNFGSAFRFGDGTIGIADNGPGSGTAGTGLYRFSIANPASSSPGIALVGNHPSGAATNTDGASCIAPYQPDLAVEKKFSDATTGLTAGSAAPAAPSGYSKWDLSWTITASNKSASGTANFFRIDDIFSGTSYSNVTYLAPSGVQCTVNPASGSNGPTLSCTGDSLSAGQSVQMKAYATYKSGQTCSPNTAKISGFNSDPVPENNTSTQDCTSNFALTKTPMADQDSSTAGNQATAPVASDGTVTAGYTVKIANNSPLANQVPNNVVDKPYLPSGMTYKSVKVEKVGTDSSVKTMTANTDYTVDSSTGTITFTPAQVGSIPAQSAISYRITYTFGHPSGYSYFADSANADALTCSSATPSDTSNPKGLLNGVSMNGEVQTDATKDNQGCVSVNLPSSDISVEKSPRPGDAVTVKSDRTATLVYTVKLSNTSTDRSGYSGTLSDITQIPSSVSVNGNVTVKWESSSGVKATNPVTSINASGFTGTVKLADDVYLNPASSQTITITVPVKVKATTADAWKALSTCNAGSDGTFTGGVPNKASTVRDKDGAGNNSACIPLTTKPATFTVAKEDANGNPLTGANFYLLQNQNGTDSTFTGGGTAASPLPETSSGSNVFTATLGAGQYSIIESKSPSGYELRPQAIKFTISYNSDPNSTSIYSFALSDFDKNSGLTTLTSSGDSVAVRVADVTSGKLPKSGSNQLIVLGILGLVLGAGGFAGFVWLRRRYE